MSLTKKDIEKIDSIVRVLGNAMKDIQELANKIEDENGQTSKSAPKRRNLKSERIEKYQYRLVSGQMRRNRN